MAEEKGRRKVQQWKYQRGQKEEKMKGERGESRTAGAVMGGAEERHESCGSL